MRRIKLVICLCGLTFKCFSQLADTSAIDDLYLKSKKYWYTNHDSSIFYLKQVETLSEKIKYTRGEGYASYGFGWHERKLYKQFQLYTAALSYFEKCNDLFGLGITSNAIGQVYKSIGDDQKAVEYTLRSIEFKRKTNDFGGLGFSYIILGQIYFSQKKYTEALENFQRSLEYRIKAGETVGIAYARANIAQTFVEQLRWSEAMPVARSARKQFLPSVDSAGKIWSTYLMAHLFIHEQKFDSAYILLEPISLIRGKWQYGNHTLMAKREFIELLKRKNEFHKIIKMQEEYIIAKDTLLKRDSRIETRKAANEFEFKVAQREKEHQEMLMTEQTARRNNLQYLLITLLVVVLFGALFSVKKLVSEKMLSALLFLGLLLFFEFLLVISDPLVEFFSGSQPLLKLLSNVFLALIILPLHTFLERLTKKKLFQQTTT